MKHPKIQASEFVPGMRIRWWKHRTYNSSVMTVTSVYRKASDPTFTEIEYTTPTGRLVRLDNPGDKFILVSQQPKDSK
jgi:hypothetical protein